MARVPDAAVLGLLASAAGLAMSDAFLAPPTYLMGHPSLSESPPLGAWRPRPRPSRGGGEVVLHARWPFGRWRRGGEKEDKQDTAQQTLEEQPTPAAVPPVVSAGAAQSEEEMATAAAAAAAAVDASTSEAVQSQASEAAVAAPDASISAPPQTAKEMETSAATAAAAAAASSSESGQIPELEVAAAVAASANSAGGSANSQEEQTSAADAGTGGDAQREAATAVAVAGTGGARARASGGRKQMSAARAAVAVMERIQDDARKEEGGGGDFSSRRVARTTRDAMLNICVKEANMTESEGASAVQTFVYVLASAPLISEAEKEELIERIEERASRVTPAPSTYASGWAGDTPSVYDDDLLRDIGARAPLVAQEIDAVLLSKPESSQFSQLLLTCFKDWATSSPADFGILARFTTADRSPAVTTAFDQLVFIFTPLPSNEAKNLRIQLEANMAGDKAFREMGNPKESLAVAEADVYRFIQEVVPSFAAVRETDQRPGMAAATGVRLVRCRVLDPFMTPEDVLRAMKARLRETGLDEKLRAFLTAERGVLATALKAVRELDREIDQLDPNDTEVMDEAVVATLDKAANDVVAGFRPSEEGKRSLADRDFLVMLVPAGTKPSEDTLLGEQGRSALALGAPITLCAFLGDAFDGSPLELASNTVDGDLHLLTQAGMLGATMIGLLLVRDAARFAAAKKVGVELAKPLALPCFETGVLARRISLASYPSNAQDLFDVVLSGPIVGLATSAAALVVGLQMTAGAGTEALAGFPSLPSSLLQGSSFVGSLVDAFLHTNLGAQDLAAERIAMHPLAVGGAVAMLWNAATVLPLPGSDGKTAIDTLNNTLPVAAVANFLAVAFVAPQVLGGGGDYLLSVLAISFVAYPNSAPLMREDNVTPVRSPLRLVLAFLVAALSLVVLTPMTLSPFLAGGAMSVDTGAGAESVAAGLGAGGVGFGGFL